MLAALITASEKSVTDCMRAPACRSHFPSLAQIATMGLEEGNQKRRRQLWAAGAWRSVATVIKIE